MPTPASLSPDRFPVEYRCVQRTIPGTGTRWPDNGFAELAQSYHQWKKLSTTTARPPVSVQRLGRLERGVGRPWGGARPALGSRLGYAGLGRQRRRSSRNAPWASPSRRRSNATKGETLRRTRKESTYATRPPGTRGDGQGARYLDRRRWGRAALAPNPFVQAPDPRSDASTCAHSLAPIQISGRAAISSISSST